MEKNVQEQVNAMNSMVTKGQIVAAAEKYFASNVKTIEPDGTITEGKAATMEKLRAFIDTIQTVNQIELRRSVSGDNLSFSEYVLDFDMKDGSHLSMHEIIRSLWENNQVIEERYFIG